MANSLFIPKSPDKLRRNGFANRTFELAQVYGDLVRAGNALRRGDLNAFSNQVVVGWRGVGKSAVIHRALECLREGPPQGSGLEAALDPQRWIVLRFSGKYISNVEALTDAVIQDSLSETREDPDGPGPRTGAPEDALLGFFADLEISLQPEVAQTTSTSFFDRLFRRDDQKLYDAARSSLRTVALALRLAREFPGATISRRVESADQRNQSAKATAAANVGAGLPGALKGFTGAEIDAAVKLSGDWATGLSTSFSNSEQLQHSVTVNARLVVNALNVFFRQMRAARLPTVLVLDDLDEIPSSDAPRPEARASVLRWMLGLLNQLRPTALVLGIRSEYDMEDVFRQYDVRQVPLFQVSHATQLVESWLDVQTLAPSPDDRIRAIALSQRLLEGRASDERIVLPFHHLAAVQRLFNTGVDPALPCRELISRFAQAEMGQDMAQLMERVTGALPRERVEQWSRALPLSRGDLPLSPADEDALRRRGFLRPALAGAPDDDRVVLDPLFALYALASKA